MYGDWTVFLKKKKHSIFRGMVGLNYIVIFLYRKIKKFIDSWNRGSGTVHAVPYLSFKGTVVWDGLNLIIETYLGLDADAQLCLLVPVGQET